MPVESGDPSDTTLITEIVRVLYLSSRISAHILQIRNYLHYVVRALHKEIISALHN